MISAMIKATCLFLAMVAGTMAKPAPTPTTPWHQVPPSMGVKPRQDEECPSRSGIATFYTAGTNPNGLTACGNTYDPSSLTGAYCTQLPGDTNSGTFQEWCGYAANVVSDSGVTVQITLDDTNANCDDYGDYQLDLSPAAWESLAPGVSTAVGTISMAWMIQGGESFPTGVACP